MKSPSRFARIALVAVLGLVSSAALGLQQQPAEPTATQRGLLFADLWVQTSGEYVACCLQTYRLAGDQVERELTRLQTEERNAAEGERGLPPAVVMDLDETVLDNSTYQSFLYDSGQNHSTELFSKWVTDERASIRLVPGAKDFIQRMEALGVTVIYIQNRPDTLRDVTIATLAQWGVNTEGLKDPATCRLLLEINGESSKTARRDLVRAKYRFLALVGDQLSDFADEFTPRKDNSVSARKDAVNEYKAMWGTRWFILPNPMYGAYQGVLRGAPEEYLRRPKEQPSCEQWLAAFCGGKLIFRFSFGSFLFHLRRFLMSTPLFDLSGRVALVTGGSKGIGKAIARGFAEAGASVVIASRHDNELHSAAAEIRHGLESGVATIVADMTKHNDVKRLADTATHAFGKIDILVNNAGTNTPQPIDQIKDEDWDRVVELNLTSCMSLTRYLVPGMKERRWGRIVFISSVMGLASLAGRGVYSSTKSAVIGLCRSVALELGTFNITANCIAPGPILTDLPMSILSEEQRSFVASRTAVGRWGNPRELAGPAVFLASEAGNYVTGSVLTVDGGILARTF